MKYVALIVVTLALHIILDWRWDILGGVAAGAIWVTGGWWRGALVVGSVWLGLVAFSLVVATGPSAELHRILVGLAGTLPAWSVPVLVICVGALIGAAGGLVGQNLRKLVQQKKS